MNRELFHRWRKAGLSALRAAQEARAEKNAPYPKSGWKPPAKDGSRWVEDLPAAGLRFVGWHDEILSARHKGWYCDSFQDDVYRGAVLMLPHGRYLAAYGNPYNKGAFRVEAEIYDDKEDAARGADEFARISAEEAREYDEAWQAGDHWASCSEAIQRCREEALALLKEIKAAGKKFSPAICETLRDHVTSLRRDMAHERKERDELRDTCPSWLKDAFNDGAREVVIV